VSYGFEIYNNNGFLLASDQTIKYFVKQRGTISSISPWGGSRITLGEGELLFVRKSDSNVNYKRDWWSFGLVNHLSPAYGMSPGQVGVAVYNSMSLDTLYKDGKYYTSGSGRPLANYASGVKQADFMPYSGLSVDYFIAAPSTSFTIPKTTSGYGMEMYDESGKVIFTSNPNYQPVNIIANISTRPEQWHSHTGRYIVGEYSLPDFQKVNGRKVYVCLNNATFLCRYTVRVGVYGAEVSETGMHESAFISEPYPLITHSRPLGGVVQIMQASLYGKASKWEYGHTLKRSPKNFLVALM